MKRVILLTIASSLLPGLVAAQSSVKSQSRDNSQTSTEAQQTRSEARNQSKTEMQIQNWSGRLVDANCNPAGLTSTPEHSKSGKMDRSMNKSGTATNDSAARPNAPGDRTSQAGTDQGTGRSSTADAVNHGDQTRSPGRSATPADQNAAQPPDQPGSGNNDKGAATHSGSTNMGSNCAVSSSTNAFGLLLKDGRVVKFDEIGNSRASEALKSSKKWSQAVNNPGAEQNIRVKVSGSMEGDKLTVMSIH